MQSARPGRPVFRRLGAPPLDQGWGGARRLPGAPWWLAACGRGGGERAREGTTYGIAANYLAVDLGALGGAACSRPVRRPAARTAGIAPFRKRPGAAGRPLDWDLLGQWSHVMPGLRAAGIRAGASRQRRRRHLGRRFRAAWAAATSAGQPLPLSRRPHQRHAGKGLSRSSPARRSSGTPACSSCSSTRCTSCWR